MGFIPEEENQETEIQEVETIDPEKEEQLNKAGLNWNVKSEGVQTMSGLIIPGRVALVREDTQTVLGVHTDGYFPYQNHELLELLHKISTHSGLSYKTGGSFGGGKRVYFQLKSGDLKLNNDRIEGSITGTNSFDGGSSLAFGTSTKTISCANTFWRAYQELETKLRHSASMRPKLEEILKHIDVLLEEEEKTFRTIERLADIRMTKEVRELVTRKMFELDKEEKLDSDEFSTRRKNQLIQFNLDLDGEIASKEDSLWGLFSGVTKYSTHSMKKTDNTENKIFGKAGKIEREVWSTLEEMAWEMPY